MKRALVGLALGIVFSGLFVAGTVHLKAKARKLQRELDDHNTEATGDTHGINNRPAAIPESGISDAFFFSSPSSSTSFEVMS